MSSYQYWQLPPAEQRKDESSLSLKTANAIPQPGKGEVLVAVKATSLNYRDLIIARNMYPLYLERGELIPVSDGAGEVAAVGEGVTRFKKGDRAAANFSIKHLKGAVCGKGEETGALGGATQGMLSQYAVVRSRGTMGSSDVAPRQKGHRLTLN